MNFVWHDYDPKSMGYIEDWLDVAAVKSTGLDEGFHNFYEYWANENGFAVGENYWCKVIFQNDEPVAVLACCLYDSVVTVMEIVVKPEKRGKGIGTKLMKELLESEKILGFTIQKSEAVIFPGNIASQKAFEKAGFRFHHAHEAGNAWYYTYKKQGNCRIHHIFGTRENAEYYSREGAYLIPVQNGLVGVVKTPKGYFFLGGGLEEGESHPSCIERECVEECGCLPVIKAQVASAESYLKSPTIGYFHPIQTYYYGQLKEKVSEPIETDHLLVWLPYDQLRGNMYLEMQNWALDQCATLLNL
jgi:8-oxo-dGTP diphosphatase